MARASNKQAPRCRKCRSDLSRAVQQRKRITGPSFGARPKHRELGERPWGECRQDQGCDRERADRQAKRAEGAPEERPDRVAGSARPRRSCVDLLRRFGFEGGGSDRFWPQTATGGNERQKPAIS